MSGLTKAQALKLVRLACENVEAEIGYDAEWDCIPKAFVGAPDIRDRVWAVAYPQHSDAVRPGSYPAAIHLVGGAELFDQQERLSGPMGAPLAATLARVGPAGGRPWDAEPQLPRVADGLPADVAAVKQFGNSLCPRISEAIGLALNPADHRPSVARSAAGNLAGDAQNPTIPEGEQG